MIGLQQFVITSNLARYFINKFKIYAVVYLEADLF
jgi:hypothetical protein